jgi:hypothetical protein
VALFCVIRWKKEEGRWKREDGRRKREDGRGKKEDIVLIDVICYAKALVDSQKNVTFAN